MAALQTLRPGLTLAICDADHFKRFNDQFGHQVGDRVLKLVSKALAKRLREVDFVARYGGEEFVVILPQTPLPNALKPSIKSAPP